MKLPRKSVLLVMGQGSTTTIVRQGQHGVSFKHRAIQVKR